MENALSPKAELRIDWATHDATVFACRNWHYSKSVPAGSTIKIGAWENGKYIGVVIFSRGATPEIGSPYGLKQTEICELTRVALTKHITPVSRIMALAFKFLKRQAPGLRMVVSFADAAQGHHGGIYQATNWTYCGGAETHAYNVNGRNVHPKTLHSKYGRGGAIDPVASGERGPKRRPRRGRVQTPLSHAVGRCHA